ncbi:hypothetical protein DFH06DRAFT_1128011 [Mycena polygramma]|nr:hypothetical protein DFH06DRAFT_1128011 [Mycena polygramma]
MARSRVERVPLHYSHTAKKLRTARQAIPLEEKEPKEKAEKTMRFGWTARWVWIGEPEPLLQTPVVDRDGSKHVFQMFGETRQYCSKQGGDSKKDSAASPDAGAGRGHWMPDSDVGYWRDSVVREAQGCGESKRRQSSTDGASVGWTATAHGCSMIRMQYAKWTRYRDHGGVRVRAGTQRAHLDARDASARRRYGGCAVTDVHSKGGVLR